MLHCARAEARSTSRAKGVAIEAEGARPRLVSCARRSTSTSLPTLAGPDHGPAPRPPVRREVTCFINNIGLGYQFAAAGSVVYRKAKEAGLGHELPTDWFTEDVHPRSRRYRYRPYLLAQLACLSRARAARDDRGISSARR